MGGGSGLRVRRATGKRGCEIARPAGSERASISGFEITVEEIRPTLRHTLTSLGSKTVRKLKLRGAIAVKSIDWTEGCTIGPPAESEYAVDPVGVDTWGKVRPAPL